MPDKFMNFTIYSRQRCPYCVQIQQVMKLAELKHVVYELDRDFNREAFYEQFGKGSTFPQVVLDGTNLGGCSDTVKYLQENNMI